MQSKGLSESSPTPQFKSINSSALCFLHSPTLTSIHDNWKNHSLDFVGKVVSVLSNMLSRLVIAFLPRSKHLLISWLQSPSAVILEPKEIASHCGLQGVHPKGDQSWVFIGRTDVEAETLILWPPDVKS